MVLAPTPEHTSSGRPARYQAGLHQIADGVNAWLAPNGGWGESNAALIAGHGASLLVDTLWDLPRTAAMLEGLRPALDGAPIAQLVNTHADGDHWFGNQLAGAAKIIATRSAARAMKRHGPGQMRALRAAAGVFRALSVAPIPGRGDWRVAADYLDGMVRPFDFSAIRGALPDTTFTGGLKVNVGGRDVHLVEVGPAHTLGDLIVHVPDARIVMAGDILFIGSTPVLWDGSARNWVRACERILELKPETVVPGHGPLTDLAGVDLVRRYWQFLRAAVRPHYEKAKPAFRAALDIATSDEFLKQPFAAWECRERIVINVHAIYRRLMGRSRRIGPLGRLGLLRRTALMEWELRRRDSRVPEEPAPADPVS